MEKYNLDSCKFLYRVIKNINNLNNSIINWHIGSKPIIYYGSDNIQSLNNKIGYHWIAIWNSFVRANIYIKSILLLNELTLNLYKNMWEDKWFNKMIDKVSYSYTIIERVGYVYFKNGQGEGTAKYKTKEQRNKMIKEWVGFLYFNYNFYANDKTIKWIVTKLRYYNGNDNQRNLKNFLSHFEVLNNLLEALIKDTKISYADKKYCEKLLNESKNREKMLKNKNTEIYIEDDV